MLMAAAAVATGEETLPIFFFKQRKAMSGKCKEKKNPRD